MLYVTKKTESGSILHNILLVYDTEIEGDMFINNIAKMSHI